MVENIFRQKQWKIFSTKIAGNYFPVEKVFHRADEFSLRRQNVIPIGAKLDETGTKRKEEKEVEHNLLLLYTLGQTSTFQSKTKIETELCYQIIFGRNYN